ncbi:hypothetical protein ACKO6X_002588 [Enterococcus hirae]|uniref:Uncharacterized protein n=1 Tax=Enterococcus faecium TaxID=1352 RepID=A0A9X3XTE1_ENTFC|nr:hypothetical protein [Enterococcus faecium]EMF0527762.1 hypothetical protein [Enterococcus hirae]MDC4247627.1 hypothetical protein [Enterococcus faecium]
MEQEEYIKREELERIRKKYSLLCVSIIAIPIFLYWSDFLMFVLRESEDYEQLIQLSVLLFFIFCCLGVPLINQILSLFGG